MVWIIVEICWFCVVVNQGFEGLAEGWNSIIKLIVFLLHNIDLVKFILYIYVMKMYIIEFGFGQRKEKVEKKFKGFLEAHNWAEAEAMMKGCTSMAVYDKVACNMLKMVSNDGLTLWEKINI